MTREEAIKMLDKWYGLFPSEAYEALDMAIEALEVLESPTGFMATYTEDRERSDLISRQAALEYFMTNTNWHDEDGDPIDDWYDKRKLLEDYFNGIPSADPRTDDENELKFYYVESLDDYWVGRRLDNFYYATWHGRLGFVWSHSKYLPWGEHIVDENTLWKEHTYPSEPIEVPFTEWIVGFVKKYFAEPKTGEWEYDPNGMDWNIPAWRCSECGYVAPHIGIADKGIGGNPMNWAGSKYCPECGCKIVGAKMRGEEE